MSNASLTYIKDGREKTFNLVVTSERRSLEADITQIATRTRSVYFSWLQRYNPNVVIGVIFETQEERNSFAQFIRDWQKHAVNNRFSTLTYKHKVWGGSGTKQHEVIVEGVDYGIKYDEGGVTANITMLRAGADNKRLNEGITVTELAKEVMVEHGDY